MIVEHLRRLMFHLSPLDEDELEASAMRRRAVEREQSEASRRLHELRVRAQVIEEWVKVWGRLF